MVFQRTLLERGRRRCDRFFWRHQQFPICLEWSFFPVDDRRGAKACHVAFTPQSSGSATGSLLFGSTGHGTWLS